MFGQTGLPTLGGRQCSKMRLWPGLHPGHCLAGFKGAGRGGKGKEGVGRGGEGKGRRGAGTDGKGRGGLL